MNNPQRVAANMPVHERKGLAVLALAHIAQVSQLADQQVVSRKFIYRQKHKAAQAIEQAFAARNTDVLFHLPVTPAWLDQLMLSLTLTCKSSARDVQESMCDMLDVPISVGTAINRVQDAAVQAGVKPRTKSFNH